MDEGEGSHGNAAGKLLVLYPNRLAAQCLIQDLECVMCYVQLVIC